MAFPNLTLLTQGLLRDTRGTSPLVEMGMPSVLYAAPPLRNRVETPLLLGEPNTPNLGLSDTTRNSLLSTGVTVFDAAGQVIVPQGNGTVVDLGGGQSLAFSPDSLQGSVFPQGIPDILLGQLSTALLGATTSYTGSDLRILMEVAEVPRIGDLLPRFSKQLLECTTLSISVHNVRSPARACGYKNPRGYARGGRTIAGTMVLTKFSTDVLTRFLHSRLMIDRSKDTHFLKVDQLPPFNMTMIFCNEHGHASYQRILGVEFVTDGSVYSIQDMLSEQTISYMASDFTPLLPLSLSALFSPGFSDPVTRVERTVRDIWDSIGGITRKALP